MDIKETKSSSSIRSEVEYAGGCLASCQAIWINSLLVELGLTVQKPIKLMIDGKSIINP